MTPPMLVRLPSGAIARICRHCAADYPNHQHFCPAVARYSRAAILRELVRVHDLITEKPTLLRRSEFWGWAWWLGLDITESTREQRDDLRVEVAEARARLSRLRTTDAA